MRDAFFGFMTRAPCPRFGVVVDDLGGVLVGCKNVGCEEGRQWGDEEVLTSWMYWRACEVS